MVHHDFVKSTAIRFTLPIKDLEVVKDFLVETQYFDNGGEMQIWHDVLDILIQNGIVIYFILNHKTLDGCDVYKVFAGLDTFVEQNMDLRALCIYLIRDEKDLIRKIEANPNFIFEEDVFNMQYSKENLIRDLLEDYKDGVWTSD